MMEVKIRTVSITRVRDHQPVSDKPESDFSELDWKLIAKVRNRGFGKLFGCDFGLSGAHHLESDKHYPDFLNLTLT